MMITTVIPCKKPTDPDSKPTNGSSFSTIAPIIILVICLGALDVAFHLMRGKEVADLRERLQTVEGMMDEVRRVVVMAEGEGEMRVRLRRQIDASDNLNEDGVPIVSSSYTGNADHNTEGLRIYDAFFQHPNENEIPQDRNMPRRNPKDETIRPHHRQSASWVERSSSSGHDLNPHFEEKVFRESYPRQSSSSSSSAGSSAASRVKFTGEGSTSSFSSKVVDSSMTPGSGTQRKSSYDYENSASSAAGRMGEEYSEGGQSGRIGVTGRLGEQASQFDARASRNRNAVRSGGVQTGAGARDRLTRHRFRTIRKSNMRSGGLSSQFVGLKSIHFVGDVDRSGSQESIDASESNGLGRARNKDGVFRRWRQARWAGRVGAEQAFGLDGQGRMTVKEAGVYLIYAQVAYLDEHDVNAFQVLANNDPFLLCTVMTHTPHSTTKANTCYTSGVRYLEQGDEVWLRDLEEGRFSVLLPQHTFFGAVQLSRFGGGGTASAES